MLTLPKAHRAGDDKEYIPEKIRYSFITGKYSSFLAKPAVGKKFYVNYKNGLRAAYIKGVIFYNYQSYCADRLEYSCIGLYNIAGLGEELIVGGLTGYDSVDDFKAGKHTPHLIRIHDYWKVLAEDLKDQYSVSRLENKDTRIDYYVWDGATPRKEKVNNFLLFHDGEKFSLIMNNPPACPYPSAESCEAANRIQVYEF